VEKDIMKLSIFMLVIIILLITIVIMLQIIDITTAWSSVGQGKFEQIVYIKEI